MANATQMETLKGSTQFQTAAKQLADTVLQASKQITGVRGSTSEELKTQYQRTIEQFQKNRGRDLFFPMMSSGFGNGPLIEMLDGSVKYDMITGIGVTFMGHCHPEMVRASIESVPSDILQGNLQPGSENSEFIDALLARTGKGSRLKHAWLMCSGTMVNEVALKIIRQKHAPATKVFAFQDGFSGRSTAMQELTDNPGYRQGQPTYGEVDHLPFFDPALSVEKNLEIVTGIMQQQLNRFPGKYAALTLELIQGEGGFRAAHRDYYVRLFEFCKKAGLAVWVDEVQTFGRTGELFAYQTFGLNELVDVVTVGKMLQACAVLFAPEYAPKPGLVSGTFAGTSVALRAAKKTLEILDDGYLGKDGKISKLSQRFKTNLAKMQSGSCKGKIGELRIHGGMVGFLPFNGKMPEVKALLNKLFELGVVAFYCGHDPYFIRMLPPLGGMNEAHVDEVCALIEKALLEVKLP